MLGACCAAGSTVLAAIETDWLNVDVNVDSTHPCTRKYDAIKERPSNLECNFIFWRAVECRNNHFLHFLQGTNWIWLEVTVAVLSAFAFCSYLVICIIVGLGLSSSSPPTTVMETRNKSLGGGGYDDTASNKTYFTSPYQAYQSQPAMNQTNGHTQPADPLYSDQHPQYSKHLQQLSVQQLAMEQDHKNATMNNKQQPAAPAAPSVQPTVQRGRLQVMYSQRGPAPPPPVPPKTYNNNNYYQ